MTTSLPWIHVCYTEERWSGEGIAWIFPAGQSAEHLGTVSSSLLFRLRYPSTQKNIGLYWIGVAFLPFISTWRNWWCLTPISHIAYTCLRNMYNILPCPNHSFSPLPLSFQRGETKVLIWPGGIGHKQSICGDTILASGKRCPKPGDFALAKHKSYMENMFPIIQIGETTPSKSVNQNLLGWKKPGFRKLTFSNSLDIWMSPIQWATGVVCHPSYVSSKLDQKYKIKGMKSKFISTQIPKTYLQYQLSTVYSICQSKQWHFLWIICLYRYVLYKYELYSNKE